MKYSPIFLGALALSLLAPLRAQMPLTLNYQGRVSVQGVNFNGTGQFKFALVDAGVNQSQQATAVSMAAGSVNFIFVQNPGAGYVTAPVVTISAPAGGGTQATALAHVAAGSVSDITITNAGSGYIEQPTVTIAPPPPNIVTSTYWSNDGTSTTGDEPQSAITLPVAQGLYSVPLADQALGMSAFDPEIFTNPLFLRVWFDDGVHGFQKLTPDQPFGAAPYAIRAKLAETVPPGAIGLFQLADNAVSAAKLADGAVSAAKLAPASVTSTVFDTGGNAPAAGQVLSFTNDGLRWSNSAAGLSLPFSSGPISAFAQPVFYIQATAASSRAITGISAQADGVYGESSSATGAGVVGSIFTGAVGAVGVKGTATGDSTGVYAQHVLGNGLALRVGGKTSLEGPIANERIEVTGQAGQRVYMGADANGDVEFGSLNPAVTTAAFYNPGSGNFLNVLMRDASVRQLTIYGGADLAEPFAMKEAARIAKGSVVVISADGTGTLEQSATPYDRKVAGIVSGANGIAPGISLHQEGINEHGQQVALTGRVYCLCDASGGPITPGDLLTTSTRPGHAMKVTDHERAQGAVLGKAMSTLESGTGYVLVLVTLQ